MYKTYSKISRTGKQWVKLSFKIHWVGLFLSFRSSHLKVLSNKVILKNSFKFAGIWRIPSLLRYCYLFLWTFERYFSTFILENGWRLLLHFNFEQPCSQNVSVTDCDGFLHANLTGELKSMEWGEEVLTGHLIGKILRKMLRIHFKNTFRKDQRF